MGKTSALSLPVELLPVILSWAPVRSLLQWRCVSKTWKSWIDDPLFARLHLTNTKTIQDETCLFMVQETIKQWKCVVRSSNTLTTIQDLVDGGDEQIGWNCCFSVDGLVMLSNSHFTLGLMLWNPSIKKTITLPPCPAGISTRIRPSNFGFGFDLLSQDYKHVVLVHGGVGDRIPWFFAVYNVGSNSWKRAEFREEGLLFPYPCCNDYEAICVGGVLYEDNGATFDLRTETFGSVNYPEMDPELEVCFSGLTTADCGRFLALAKFTKFDGYIWVLREGVWTQSYKFPMVDPNCGVAHWDRPYLLYLTKNGEVLMNWEKVVTSYSIETGDHRILLEEELAQVDDVVILFDV